MLNTDFLQHLITKMPPRLAAMAGGSSSQLGSSVYRPSDSYGSSRGDTEMDGSTVTLEELDVDTLYLQPPAFKRKEKGKWQASGHTLAFGLNPVDGSVASWITHRVSLRFWWMANFSRRRKLVKPLPPRSHLCLLSISSSRLHRLAIFHNRSLRSTPNLIPSSLHCNIS
jgi:hypothetical protein